MPGLPPQIVDGAVTLTWGTSGRYYGYCTIADVDFEFADSDAFTTLTASVVGQEITNAAVELQAMLEHVYVMPYAGTDGGILATLRDINAKLATSNLMDRYFQGSVPNESSAAAERRHFAESILVDVLDGHIHWNAPFGDAIPNAQMPVYRVADLAQLSPTPSPDTAPVFVMGRSSWRGDIM